MTDDAHEIWDGEKLKTVLESEGISKSKFATKLGINRRTVYSWFQESAFSHGKVQRIKKAVASLNKNGSKEIPPFCVHYPEAMWAAIPILTILPEESDEPYGKDISNFPVEPASYGYLALSDLLEGQIDFAFIAEEVLQESIFLKEDDLFILGKIADINPGTFRCLYNRQKGQPTLFGFPKKSIVNRYLPDNEIQTCPAELNIAEIYNNLTKPQGKGLDAFVAWEPWLFRLKRFAEKRHNPDIVYLEEPFINKHDPIHILMVTTRKTAEEKFRPLFNYLMALESAVKDFNENYHQAVNGVATHIARDLYKKETDHEEREKLEGILKSDAENIRSAYVIFPEFLEIVYDNLSWDHEL